MKHRSLMKNSVSLVEAYDEFDWEILMKSFKSKAIIPVNYLESKILEKYSGKRQFI